MYIWSTGINSSDKGIVPDLSKVNTVTNVNVTKVCGFRELVNYSAQLIPTYAETPQSLTKKYTIFKCVDEYQKIFKKFKVVLTDCETTVYYILDAETKVILDTLPVDLRATLPYKSKTAEFRPVDYASKSLNPTK